MFPGKNTDLNKKLLADTVFFKLISMALIAYMTPVLTFYTRGIIGFSVMIFLALIVGSVDKSLTTFLHNIRDGISKNRFFFFLIAWYAVGVIINTFMGEGGFNDWRLIISPILLLVGISITFGIYLDDKCSRLFQIWMILVFGAQAIYSNLQFIADPSIIRLMIVETQGAWVYGNQVTFALFAIMLPIFIWRTISINGVMRSILISAVISIFVSILLSTLATPISLVFSGAIFMAFMLIFFPFSKRNYSIPLIISALIIGSNYFIYASGRNVPILSPIYYRLENLLADPTSGGYSGMDLDQSRWKKAKLSVDSFIQNPLFGMGTGNTRTNESGGGHSSLLDTLGGYGLLGGGGALCGLISIMMISSFKRYRRERDGESLVCTTAVFLLVIAGIVNPYWEGFQPVAVFLFARPLLERRL